MDKAERRHGDYKHLNDVDTVEHSITQSGTQIQWYTDPHKYVGTQTRETRGRWDKKKKKKI